MKPTVVSEKNKAKWRFTALFLGAVLLLFLIFFAFSGSLRNSTQAEQMPAAAKAPDEESKILLSDEILHNRLKYLQELDDRYSGLLTDSSSSAERDSLSKIIAAEEEAFRKTIDSIELQGPKYVNGNNSTKVFAITGSFRNILKNRAAMANIRTALAGSNANLSADQQTILKWQNDLLRKDERIMILESQLKMSQANYANRIAANNAKPEDESLIAKLAEMEKTNNNLTATNNSLKQDNQQLNARLSDLRKSASVAEGNEKTASDKTASLEQKIEELNAELRLAKVDCNLSRADAKQIISNSKQRKDLLAEALQVLNNLSRSDDAAIQKKVKEKTERLNTIASTVRD